GVPLSNNSSIEQTSMQQIDENTMQMEISYTDGTVKTLRGEKAQDSVAFYLDNQHVTTVSNDELSQYVAVTHI
ncbi:hypothetical protein AKJ18_28655, partial [Vibrio xuii]